MTDTEKEIKHREKQLEDYKYELKLMEKDHTVVRSDRSDRSKRSIEDNIDSVKRRIESLEFKLWKLNR